MNETATPSLQDLFADANCLKLLFDRSGAHTDLGLEFVSAESAVHVRVPFSERLIRSTSNRAIHAGAVMTAIDSAMGLATLLHMSESSSLATLELRYDELCCPEPESAIEVSAKHEDTVDGIAYSVASARNVGNSAPFARAVGRFILKSARSGFLEQARQLMREQDSEQLTK